MIKSVIGSLDVTPTGGHRPRQRWRQWSKDLLRRGQGALEMKNVVSCQQIHLRWNRLFSDAQRYLLCQLCEEAAETVPERRVACVGGRRVWGVRGGGVCGDRCWDRSVTCCLCCFYCVVRKMGKRREKRETLFPPRPAFSAHGWLNTRVHFVQLAVQEAEPSPETFQSGGFAVLRGVDIIKLSKLRWFIAVFHVSILGGV